MPNDNHLKISSWQTSNSFGFDILGKRYFIEYPPMVFSSLPKRSKRILAENFVYCRTKPISLITKKILSYQGSRPVLKDFINYGIFKDLPRVAFFEKTSTNILVKLFLEKKNLENFEDKILANQPMVGWKADKSRAILALSFGKDSLLSYGIAKEIGLKLNLVYVLDKNGLDEPEEVHKKKIISNFIKREKVEINYLFDNADSVFLNKILEKKIEELENTNGMSAFMLELVPFAKYYKAKYLIFGNEANFSDYFYHDGFKAYPSFDQSIFYAKKGNQNLGSMTKSSVQTVSLVEPIYNIVEMAVLVNRYPHLLSYMMSCSPKKNDLDKWCYHCPMCAKAFLYLLAVGGKKEQIGFNEDFFELKYKKLYPLFNVRMNRAYEKPKAVRDEQLLAFLLAYRRGLKGDLINLFEKKYLDEAKKRERTLRKKFLGINSMATIPFEIRNKIINIYKEEIKKII